MLTLGIVLIVVHCIFLLESALMISASFAGFTGAAPMVASAVICIVLWSTYVGLTIRALRLAGGVVASRRDILERSLRWSSALLGVGAALSAVTGILLAFGAFSSCGPLWVSNLYHWLGMIGTVLAFVCFFVFPFVVRVTVGSVGDHSTAHRWWVPLVTAFPVALTWSLVWIIAYVKLSGDLDLTKYPKRSTSPYKLPFPSGESSWVIQGNESSLNHNKNQAFAFDFRRECGTPVVAARDGLVTTVVDGFEGNGTGKSNNMIQITHPDQSIGRYLHIQKGSAKVKVNDRVARGAVLAAVGNVGNSLTGHIHFDVQDATGNIRITFSDVTEDNGIPRTFSSYTSKNK